MSFNEKISIIVPIYNTEKYLKKCIKSLVNQTYKNLEIILINDGSTDSSLSICRNFAKKDSRIIVIDKENQGLILTRKKGIEAASSKYVSFIDSDDFLKLDAIEIAAKALFENNADVVCFGVIRKLGFLTRETPNSAFIAEHDEFMEAYYKSYFGQMFFSPNAWGKLYKKDLFNNVTYENIFFGEDLLLNLQIMCKAEKVVSIPDCLYFYRANGGTSKFNPKLLNDYETVKKYQIEYRQKYNFSEYCLKTIHLESTNTFEKYIYSYLSQNNSIDASNVKKVDDYYTSTPFLQNAIEYFKTFDNIDDICNDKNMTDNIRLLINFNSKEYCEHVSRKIIADQKSLSRKIRKFL